MNRRNKFLSLMGTLMILLIVLFLIIPIEMNKTGTRYIQSEKDEIRAYYTALYFDGTGEGNCIALENNIGYVSFDLMNYIDEDVTERDIEYEIKTIHTFYDAGGNEINNENITEETDLYVLDVWKTPKKIGNDTYKYEINVVQSTGDTVKRNYDGTEQDYYFFEYEKGDSGAIGKKHNTTIKVERTTQNSIEGPEYFSIVVQLVKPYREVFIINMVISDRLISFSNYTDDNFGINIEKLQIQTANIFKYTSDNSDRVVSSGSNEQIIKKFTSKAFRVTLSWDNMLLDEARLKYLHKDIFKFTESEASNIDIAEIYILSLSQSDNHGEMTLYVPQGSDFTLNFMPISNEYYVYAKIEIVDNDQNNNYVLYDKSFAGYTDAEIISEGTYKDFVLVASNDKNSIVH